jgi:hypothetical protein
MTARCGPRISAAHPPALSCGKNPPCDDGSVTQLSRDADSMIVKSTEYDNEAGMGFADRIV